MFNLNTVIFCSIAVPVSLLPFYYSLPSSPPSISLVCLHSYFVSYSPRYTFHLSMSIGNGAIHIHLLIASTSGAWTPSSMRSNAPWTLQLGVHSLFHLYSFLLIHFLHAVEVGEARWLPLLPPSSPPPHIVSCILYLIARSLYIFLTSHRNGSCVVQTSSSAWGAGYRGRGRGRAWSGSGPGHGYGYLWRSSVPVRTRSQVGTRIWILTMAAASD